MKFLFWTLKAKHKDSVSPAVILSTPASPLPVTSSSRLVTPTVIPIPVNPVVREMEVALGVLVYRVTETLAKTELYFPASDLKILGVSQDSPELCQATDHKARELLLRSEIKNGERYVAFATEIAGALQTAQHAALLIRLLCADGASAAALPLLRRVSDTCERVVRHSAKVLEVPTTDIFKWSNSVIAAKDEAQIAIHKAMTLLGREPALLPLPTIRMARTAIWAMEIAAEGVSHAALECRGVVLPGPVSVETRRESDKRYPISQKVFASV